MTEQTEDFREQPVPPFNQPSSPLINQPVRRRPLPNASAVLVLGICSVVLGCFAVGLVTGIIGLVLARKSKMLYRENPETYDDYGNVQAGFILSIVGVCLGGLALIYYIFIFTAILFGAAGTAVGSGYTV